MGSPTRRNGFVRKLATLLSSLVLSSLPQVSAQASVSFTEQLGWRRERVEQATQIYRLRGFDGAACPNVEDLVQKRVLDESGARDSQVIIECSGYDIRVIVSRNVSHWCSNSTYTSRGEWVLAAPRGARQETPWPTQPAENACWTNSSTYNSDPETVMKY